MMHGAIVLYVFNVKKKFLYYGNFNDNKNLDVSYVLW